MKITNHLSVILFFASITVFTACDKDDAFTPDPTQINFQTPAAGQENYYLRHEGICGQLVPTNYTLVLRVRSFEGDILEFEEVFTEGSPSYYPGITYVYQAKWSPDNIEINPFYRQNSQLFFFYGSDSLRLTQDPAINLQQNNCVVWDGLTDFTGDFIGAVNNFRVAGLEYQNKKIVSCVPTILNMDAYLVYDSRNLYSSFTSSLGGSEPIEHPYVIAYALINKG